MFVTKIKGGLAVVLVVGLALGGIGAGVGLSINPVAVAQQKQAEPKDSPLIVHSIVESVDGKKAAITVKAGDPEVPADGQHCYARRSDTPTR